jgi:AcrR family transcriptional regulator
MNLHPPRYLPVLDSDQYRDSPADVKHSIPLGIVCAVTTSARARSGAGRTRPPRSQTRRRVLDAAAAVFAARGIASSSVNDIAEAAGLTKGAVYSNFASKDDLILALMQEHVRDRLRDAIAAFEAAEDVDVGIHDLFASLVRAIAVDADWQHLLFEYCALARRDSALHEGLQRCRREARDAVARAIAVVAESRGLDLPMSPDEVAVVMLAISNGLALEGGIDADAVPADLFPRLAALILRRPLAATRP